MPATDAKQPTPSTTASTSAINGTSPQAAHPPPAPRRPSPFEVGWTFVSEYYTILNKDPARLHCFYAKPSSMLHGVEGEFAKTCIGQAEIHQRFVELQLQDSKVIVSSVDCQSSVNGSLLVTVIGEMEERGNQAARRFTQTFVLAEQPNGYYVHNDLFRFLKEDFELDQPLSDDGNDATPNYPDDINGDATVDEQVDVDENVVESHEDLAAQSHPQSPSKPVVPPVVQQPVPLQEPTPALSPAKAAQPVPASPPKSMTPTTWASLATSGKERWGEGVSEVKGISTTAPVVPQGIPTSPVQTPNAAPTAGKQETAKQPGIGKKENHYNNNNGNYNGNKKRQDNATVFVTGFSKATKLPALKETFGQAFGPVRWVDMVSESSAYFEFVDVAHAQKALSTGQVQVGAEQARILDRKSGPPVPFRGNKKKPGSGYVNNNNNGNNNNNNMNNNASPSQQPPQQGPGGAQQQHAHRGKRSS